MLSIFHPRRVPQVWWIALVGVAASLPATAIVNWLPDSEATIGGGVMIIGATLAGALAVTWSVDPGAVGLRAGFLGGATAILAFVLTEAPTVTWTPSRLVFFSFASAAILVISPVFGLVFGRIGGWIAGILTKQ